MLEIIAIIYFSRKNGDLAASKGLRSKTWILYTVLAWFGFEIAGVLAGLVILGKENIYSVYLLAIGSAVLGYFVVRNILLKKQDNLNDDINQIGVSDLYPDKNNNSIKY